LTSDGEWLFHFRAWRVRPCQMAARFLFRKRPEMHYFQRPWP